MFCVCVWGGGGKTMVLAENIRREGVTAYLSLVSLKLHMFEGVNGIVHDVGPTIIHQSQHISHGNLCGVRKNVIKKRQKKPWQMADSQKDPPTAFVSQRPSHCLRLSEPLPLPLSRRAPPTAFVSQSPSLCLCLSEPLPLPSSLRRKSSFSIRSARSKGYRDVCAMGAHL